MSWRRFSRRNRYLRSILNSFGVLGTKATRSAARLLDQEWYQLKKISIGVADEVAAVLIALNLYPLGLVNLERLQVLSSVLPKRPILLVHGYFHNNSVFYVLKRRLFREGRKQIYSINLRTYATGIDECAQEISKKVKTILQDTGAERVDLIGHSFGGLCARYFVQVLDGAEKVDQCITIGTPHQGSTLAYFGFGPANLDMQPGSDVLRELNEERALPPEVEFTNIWSPFDYMVIPIEDAIMEGRVRNIKVDYIGHLGMLFSRKVFNDIFLSLAADSIQRKVAPTKKARESSVAYIRRRPSRK